MRVELDLPFTIDELCSIIKSNRPRCLNKNSLVNAISTDTRDCRTGDLFIALDGGNKSGEDYVDDAMQKGCIPISISDKKSTLRVKDTSEALLNMAEAYKNKILPKHTIAITGSYGKSTTTRFLSIILAAKYKVHATSGNFNNHIGVPLTVLSMPKNTEVLIAELGMNHRNEISRLSRCVRPNLGIITAIGTSHIGNLGSREKIATAKLEVLHGIKNGTLLIPYEEPLLKGIDNGIYVGRNSPCADYSFNNGLNDSFSLKTRHKQVDGIEFLHKREHLLYDLAFAVSAAEILRLSNNEIIRGVGAITNPDIRQRFIVIGDFVIYDDSYNASIESITADLKYIRSLNRPTGALLGDIMELGDNAQKIHEQVGRVAAKLKIDRLYLYGQYAEYVFSGAKKEGFNTSNIYMNTDTSNPEITMNHIKENHQNGEVILFKASHKVRLDKIADLMKEERKNNE